MANQLTRTLLGDGIAFNLIEDGRFKHDRISVNFVLPLRRETATGYALLPFLMQRGYAGCSDFTDFARKLDELYGASVAGRVSKAGEYQIITLSITHVDDRYTLDGEGLVEACARLLADIVCHPAIENGRFDPAMVATEKNSLLDTIAAEMNDKRSYAVARCTELLFEGEPLAVKQYGYAEDVAAITPESAARCYETMLETAAVEIVMIGAGAKAAVGEIFREAFAGALAGRKRAPITPVFEMEQKLPQQVRAVTEEMDLTQAKMVLGFSVRPAEEKRDLAISRIAAAVYGSSPFSKLFMNVREKLSLCYYCASRMVASSGYMLVDCGIEVANKEKAEKEILHQLEEVCAGSFTDTEMKNAKLAVVNSLRTVTDSLSAMENWLLTEILQGGRSADPTEEIALTDSVTAEEVQQFMKSARLSVVYLLAGKKGE